MPTPIVIQQRTVWDDLTDVIKTTSMANLNKRLQLDVLKAQEQMDIRKEERTSKRAVASSAAQQEYEQHKTENANLFSLQKLGWIETDQSDPSAIEVAGKYMKRPDLKVFSREIPYTDASGRKSTRTVSALQVGDKLVQIKDPSATTLSNIGKMVQERDLALAKGDKALAETYDKAISRAANGSEGVSVTDYNPDGTLKQRITVGGSEVTPPGDIDRVVGRKIQEKIMTLNESLARLNEIEQQFNPEVFDEWSKGKNQVVMFASRALGITPSDAQIKFNENATMLEQDALLNLNLTIKEITGAQMNKSEADRIQKTMPVYKKGMFQGNNMYEFMAKLKNITNQIRNQLKRNQFYLDQKGWTANDIKQKAETNSLPSETIFRLDLEAMAEEVRQQALDEKLSKDEAKARAYNFIRRYLSK